MLLTSGTIQDKEKDSPTVFSTRRETMKGRGKRVSNKGFGKTAARTHKFNRGSLVHRGGIRL